MRIKLGRPILARQVALICQDTVTPAHLADCLQAVTHLATDSRSVMPGDMFVALKGNATDGHHYINDAVSRGASVILTHKNIPDIKNGVCYIHCRDTGIALRQLAEGYIRSIPHKTIAITGSVGKTTTRRFISSVLSHRYQVHESPHNYNNMLGTCLHLLSCPSSTQYLVSECGMNHRGEIEAMSRMLSPDIAVITNIGISHIETLKTQENICLAKLEITAGMKNGTLFCSGDDAHLPLYVPNDAQFVSLYNTTSPYHCEQVKQEANGILFTFVSPDRVIDELYIPTIGMHTLSCAAFAVAVGIHEGLTDHEIRRGLAEYAPEEMRQIQISVGDNTILFDAYNACPASMLAANETLHILATRHGGEKIVLLGDMAELGPLTETAHRDIGAAFALSGAKHIFLWGDNAPMYVYGATNAGYDKSKITVFDFNTDIFEISNIISRQISARDVLLIKGSRRMKMERLLPLLQEKMLEKNYKGQV